MNVESYLRESGLNVHQLSQKAGVSYEILRLHVKGKGKIGLVVAQKLAAFDCRLTVADVIGLHDHEKTGAALEDVKPEGFVS